MKTTPECIACFMKWVLLATQRMTDDPKATINAIKRAAELIPSINREKARMGLSLITTDGYAA